MALADLMAVSLDQGAKKVGLSEERISAQIDKIRQYVSF